jgi:hypothetical protein
MPKNVDLHVSVRKVGPGWHRKETSYSDGKIREHEGYFMDPPPEALSTDMRTLVTGKQAVPDDAQSSLGKAMSHLNTV